MTGTVIVPSRARPANIARLLEAFGQTGAWQHVRLIVAVDDDDPDLAAYRDLCGDCIDVAPRERIGPRVNTLAVTAAADSSWVGFMGDDHLPRTEGWWRLIDDALAPSDPPGVVYGDDLLQGRNLATAVFISAALIERLGYMHAPGLWHLYLDNFWMMLGRETRLVYEPRLIVEHLHPLASKAEWDDSYRANNAREMYERDGAEFQRYVREDWPTERLKLQPVASRVAP